MAFVDIDDIVEKEIVDKMDVTLKVKSVELIGNSFRIEVCDLKFVRLLTYLEQTIDETTVLNWGIVDNSFDGNSFIVYGSPGDELKKGDVLTMKRPYYFRGTPLAVNDEWRELTPLELNKLPMIWLAQPTEEDWRPDLESIERISDLTVFFIASANFRDDLTKDHRVKQVTPLLNMVSLFVDTAKGNPMFKRKDIAYKTRDFSRFGTETKQGIQKNIIDSELSAVRLRLPLPIYKTGTCTC